MGIHSRFQYALGFGIGMVLHLKAMQDVEESLRQQRLAISMIRTQINKQIVFREDVGQEFKLSKTFYQVYHEWYLNWLVGFYLFLARISGN